GRIGLHGCRRVRATRSSRRKRRAPRNIRLAIPPRVNMYSTNESCEAYVKKDEPAASQRRHYTKVIRVGGRDLRVAVWKAKAGAKPQRPLLFFNGIGANIEAMSPLADWFTDRDIVTYDMPGVGQSP